MSPLELLAPDAADAVPFSVRLAERRLTGRETIAYTNHSPDTLRIVTFHLYQNLFAEGALRGREVPLTGGMRLGSLAVDGASLEVPAGPDGAAWRDAAAVASDALGLDIETYRIGDELVDGGDFCEKYGIEDGGAVLVRPDGYVAWRSRQLPDDDCGKVLLGVLERVLSRTNGAAA